MMCSELELNRLYKCHSLCEDMFMSDNSYLYDIKTSTHLLVKLCDIIIK